MGTEQILKRIISLLHRLKEETPSSKTRSTLLKFPSSTRFPRLWVELCWLWRDLVCWGANMKPGESLQRHAINHPPKSYGWLLLYAIKTWQLEEEKEKNVSGVHIPPCLAGKRGHLIVQMKVSEECGPGMLQGMFLLQQEEHGCCFSPSHERQRSEQTHSYSHS